MGRALMALLFCFLIIYFVHLLCTILLFFSLNNWRSKCWRFRYGIIKPKPLISVISGILKAILKVVISYNQNRSTKWFLNSSKDFSKSTIGQDVLLKNSGKNSYEISWIITTVRQGDTGGTTYWKCATSILSRTRAIGKENGILTSELCGQTLR